MSFNNLAITATNSAMIHAVGGMMNTLHSLAANGGRDRNCKFYHSAGGGSVIKAIARSVVGGAVHELKHEADNWFDSVLFKKKKPVQQSSKWIERENKYIDEEKKKYGRMIVSNQGLPAAVLALDDWGCVCNDALMLGIKVDEPVTITQTYPDYSAASNGIADKKTNLPQSKKTVKAQVIKSDTLVWYDTTALINISSGRNIIITKVQGRDYSRKELVSNGDIKFSVSGQITSAIPDVYPEAEVKKFVKVMNYKGIIEVNNQVLDQLGISHIIITDFSLSPKEGYKSVQKYSFSAIGLQPEREIAITEDTIDIYIQPTPTETKKEDGPWKEMLKNQLDGLKSMASDAASSGLGLSIGWLDSL